MQLSCFGLTPSKTQLYNYPSSHVPTAEFPVNHQRKSKQTPLLHNSVYLFYPSASVQIMCSPSPPGWKIGRQERISRWLAQISFAMWVEGEGKEKKKKKRKGLRQKSPGEWLDLNQASPIQKSPLDCSNKWIVCLGSKVFSAVLPKGLFHLHFL